MEKEIDKAQDNSDNKSQEKIRFWDFILKNNRSTQVPLRAVLEAAKKTSGIYKGLYLTSDSKGRTVLQGEVVKDGIAGRIKTSEIVAVHTSSGTEVLDEDLEAYIGRHRNYMTKSGSVYHTGVFSWFELKKESIELYDSLPKLCDL